MLWHCFSRVSQGGGCVVVCRIFVWDEFLSHTWYAAQGPFQETCGDEKGRFPPLRASLLGTIRQLADYLGQSRNSMLMETLQPPTGMMKYGELRSFISS